MIVRNLVTVAFEADRTADSVHLRCRELGGQRFRLSVYCTIFALPLATCSLDDNCQPESWGKLVYTNIAQNAHIMEIEGRTRINSVQPFEGSHYSRWSGI